MAGEKVRRTAGCVEISGRRCGFGGGAASGLSDMFQQFFRAVDDGLCSVLQQSITGAEAPGNAYAGQAGVLCCFNVHFGIADVYVRFSGSVLGGNQGEDSVRRRFLLYGVAHALRIIYQPLTPSSNLLETMPILTPRRRSSCNSGIMPGYGAV